MSERIRESLSALMDNEANELELQRVLSSIEEDAEMRQVWVRYHAIRSVVSGQLNAELSLDISQRVRASIAQEGNSSTQSTVQRLLKPLASFAVAASVAAVVVVGGQQISKIQDGGSYTTVGTFPVGASGVPIQARYGVQRAPVLQPALPEAYRELARQRMQKYMQEHAEHAALNSPQGLVPFVRVQQIRE